jgi:hypothetical protein
MSVSDDVKAAENALRDLIHRQFMISGKNMDAASLGVTDERFNQWNDRRTSEAKKRDGIRPESRILYFADLTDLHQIIHKNWAEFKPCFDDKKKFDVYLDRVAELRDPNAHSRDLSPFERELISGICGEIRQAVTLYLSEMNGEREHFPRIERVQDSFGNAVPNTTTGNIGLDTGLILRPGDVVTFVGDAWDPESLDVSWSLFIAARGIEDDFASGSRMEYTWNVTEKDIGDPVPVLWGITSQRSFHRRSSGMGRDDSVFMTYRVLPSLS